MDSLSYDLCDLLSIPHDEKDSANYGIFDVIKQRIDELKRYVNFMSFKDKDMILKKYKDALNRIVAILTLI